MATVALYGNSLLVSTIGASLQDCADLQLVQVDATLLDAAEHLRALQPAAVLFDLAAGQPDFAMSLLCELPGLLLIGVDPSSDDLLVVSCHSVRALSAADLVDVIEHKEQGTKP